MEKTLSKKQKTVYSAAAILVFLVLVYLGDTLIPMTSQWNMLMTVIEKGGDFCTGCGINELTERLYGTFLPRTGRLHAYRSLCLCDFLDSCGSA